MDRAKRSPPRWSGCRNASATTSRATIGSWSVSMTKARSLRLRPVPDLAHWPPTRTDAVGQAGEFLVWAAMVTQSGGGLHVFLPLLDRGIDGLIHRLDDGA